MSDELNRGEQMDAVFAYMTTSDKKEAKRIGKELVSQRLAACVNIIDGMESFYWWEGKVEGGKETVLIAKTNEALVEKLTAEVKRLHSYSCPCVITLPIKGGNPDYLAWLEENVKVK